MSLSVSRQLGERQVKRTWYESAKAASFLPLSLLGLFVSTARTIPLYRITHFPSRPAIADKYLCPSSHCHSRIGLEVLRARQTDLCIVVIQVSVACIP